jgi:AcrR family transcriptional regulator
LAAQHRSRGRAGREASKREERERRILDATAELLQRWGYRKTTLEDIAKTAGVAKGTIYLSWKTREEIFLALIEREELGMLNEIERRMEEDPEGMTLPGLVKHSILATLESPLLKALALQDTNFLSELIIREYSAASYQAQMQSYMAILETLRGLGVIRADIGVREQALTTISVSWGFLLVNPMLPDSFKFTSDEQMVELITTSLKRLLEPDIPPTDEQRRAGEQAMRAYVEQAFEMARQQGITKG